MFLTILFLTKTKIIRNPCYLKIKNIVMSTFNEPDIFLNIQQLIDKNRCGIDGFFTDSKTAANDILMYLVKEKIIIKNEMAVEIEFNKTSKAA